METPEQVLLSLGFILGAIGLSLWQRLNLAGPIVVATGRSILQMIVFCYLLAVVFAAQTSVVTAITALGLIIVSSLLIHNQINERVPFLWPMLSGSLLLSSIVTLGYSQIFVTPTWGVLEAKSVIPFLGMLLSSMSASSIAVTQLIKNLNTRRLEIETHLSLGATGEQAIAPYRRDAVRSALMPQISALTVLGLGVLPIFMSGELIGVNGTQVLQAGAYQLLVLFMSLFATLLTTVLITIGVSRQFLTKAAQLVTW
jgi:putative ABC transport system permease protein